MKIALALENIRRIQNTPEIEIRPITILVGRNSAGKSTFLRSLPLIRQSLETRSSAPILWYGRLVDFGDLVTAIGGTGKRKLAAFRFLLREVETATQRQDYYYDFPDRQSETVVVNSVSIRYVIGNKEDTTLLTAIEVSIPDEDIKVSFEFAPTNQLNGIMRVNGDNVNHLFPKLELRKFSRRLFSYPMIISRTARDLDSIGVLVEPERALEIALLEVLQNQISRTLSRTTYHKEIRKLLSQRGPESSSIENLVSTSTSKTFARIYKHLCSNDTSEFKTRVRLIQKLARAFVILKVADLELTTYFRNVQYLGPVRAASERYYRRQELEVSEIAADGSNFPMFLASLRPRDLDSFSKWVSKLFNFGVELCTQGGHISIHVKSGSQSVNVTDTGYGVSQMLPVLGVIWQSGRKVPMTRYPGWRRNQVRTIAIEQPELHLHPAHQARLADVLVAAIARQSKDNTSTERRFVIETHSEAIVQRLGELIEEEKVSPKQIQIVIFSANDDLGSPTEVSISEFDDSGLLLDWPYGFFNFT